MFRGRFEHNIDAKGRTSLPSKFREVLLQQAESRLVITVGLDACAMAYPYQEWLAFEEKLAALPRFDPDVAMLRRIVLSAAVECEIDKVGRILIPSTLRKHADISKQIVWAGMGKHIELWSAHVFGEYQQQILGDDEKRAEVAKRLAELGL